LVDEALGRTGDRNRYVYLSDGGHFDNLGLYEIVKRRCHTIVVCDATADPTCQYGDLGEAVRRIYTDFGIRITMNDVRFHPGVPLSDARRCAVGTIHYSDIDSDGDYQAPNGVLIYLKPSRHAAHPIDLVNHAKANPKFPHDPTSNQWFSEAQFESYRRLGYDTVTAIAQSVVPVSAEPGRRTTISLTQFCDAARGGTGTGTAESVPDARPEHPSVPPMGESTGTDPRESNDKPVNPDESRNEPDANVADEKGGNTSVGPYNTDRSPGADASDPRIPGVNEARIGLENWSAAGGLGRGDIERAKQILDRWRAWKAFVHRLRRRYKTASKRASIAVTTNRRGRK